MRYYLTFGIIIIFLFSCQTENKTYYEIENPAKLKSGEWINQKDSLSGISIRKQMLAFYENNKFTADSVYEFIVIDSISVVGKRENKIGTYIKRMNSTDTLYSKINKFTDSTLTLKKHNRTEIYKLK
jgi:hypothetical protein